MFRFVAIFLVCLIGLFTLDVLQPVERAVIEPFNAVLAQVSTFVMNLFDADPFVQGKIIRSTAMGFAISIERACNGVEALIILVSAMVAFPSPWRHKLAGIGIGFIAIQSLNILRIISLFYLGKWDRDWFDFFHLYLWQALIILDALVVFLLWLRYLPRPAQLARPHGDGDVAVRP